MALHGVHNSVEAGVDSIEHGNYIADEDMRKMLERGIWYVPTLFVGEYVAKGRGGFWPAMIKVHEDTFRKALKMGVKIAFGSDAGGFDWNVNPAIEFTNMTRLGMTPMQAILSATARASELLDMQKDVGTLEAGSSPTSSPCPATRWPMSAPCQGGFRHEGREGRAQAIACGSALRRFLDQARTNSFSRPTSWRRMASCPR